MPEPGYRLPRLIARQFRGVFNVLLLAAAATTFALGDSVDGLFILLFVFLGATLNVLQEHKANAAVDQLRGYLVRMATVRRDGRAVEVPTTEIVPGDVLELEAGDVVPADAVVLEGRDLLVDETTFTGESIPAPIVAAPAVSAAGHEHQLLQGVAVTRGRALAEVTATGSRTRLAAIAATASAVQAESELISGIDRISGFVMRATLLTLAGVVLVNVLIEGRDADVVRLLVFAIALAVSVIPEALPLVLTFSLSRGALRFARQKVIVKRLSSVQDLGAVTLLCTDKTGTITENRLVSCNAMSVPGSPFHPMVLARLAAQRIGGQHPEPFDRAIDEALTAEQRATVNRFAAIEFQAFDPVLRGNGAVVRRDDGMELRIRRGSVEPFVERGLAVRQEIGRWLADEERLGHRVLAVSWDDGTGPRFGGLVSFVDRLKETTAETLSEAARLNVAITVITGDARRVAAAVGREAGLVTGDEQVIEAVDFLALPLAERTARLDSIRVFARTTPEQKLALISLLKQRYTVAFLGEGINDAPALKAAHVSLVVPSASDVARETADIVLLENDLRVIVDGIRAGRETHANIAKYLRATLVSNFGNFYAVAIGSLFISFLPMLPKQLLLLNFLSDFPMMAIAFDRVPAAEVAFPRRYDFRSLYIILVTLGLVSTVFDFVFFALFYRISPEVLQTNWFIASVMTELLLVLSIRSMLPVGQAGWPAPVIVILSAAALALSVALPLIPRTAAWFGFARPDASHLGLIFLLSLAYLAVSEVAKRPLVRFLTPRPVAAV